MINIFIHYGWAFLALTVVTIILHFLLVWPRNLSKTQRKKIDYIWISLTALGLVGATNTVRVNYNKARISLYDNSIPFRYHYVLSFLGPDGSTTICGSYVKDKYSPPDFDSVVADQKRSCEWTKQVYNILSHVDTTNYHAIDTTKIPPLVTKEAAWFREMIFTVIREYNQQVNEKAKLQAELDDEFATAIQFYTPFFLILGLAIRITKVSGELRHEIQAKKSAKSPVGGSSLIDEIKPQ